MNECRKFGCTSAALPYPRYEGYCSFQCQYVGELDDEIAELKAKANVLEALAKHWEHIAAINGKELETVHGQLDEALSLIDGAKPLVEIFESGRGSWDAWRSDWLERAVKLLKVRA